MSRRKNTIGGTCQNGHDLTADNVKIRNRKDRGSCSVECKTCSLLGMRVFHERRPLYDVWKTMIRRCSDPTYVDWGLYGGKGIRVCDRWLASLDNFVADMGQRPSKQHTLDRIDSNGDYCPENCRWATAKQQARNMSRNNVIEFNGRKACLAEWAELTGMKYMTLFQRFNRGWSVEKALTAEVA